MRLLCGLLLLAVLLPSAYAVDTAVDGVELSDQAQQKLGRFSDPRIKGIGYWKQKQQVVFVSEQPLSDADVAELTAALTSFVPQDTPDEVKKKELKAKSKLTADELTELLRLKGVI